MDNKLSPSELLIVAGGVVALLGSFLDWVSVGGQSANAWSDGAFPTYTYVGIIGALMAAQVLIRNFANVKMPEQVLGFSWPQIHLVLAVYCVLTALGFLIIADNKAIGFWLSAVASVVLVLGALRLRSEAGATA